MPSLGMLVMFNSGTYLSYLPPELKRWILIFTLVSTFLLPLTVIYFLSLQGIVKSVHLKTREERLAPMVISLILYVFCFYLIKRIDVPKLYNAFLFSGIISIAITLLITTRFKISIHMVGLGGLTALVAFLAFHLKVDLQFYLIVVITLAGITGTARLNLKAHTSSEIYSGYFLGLTTVLFTMLWF
jgi:hypothetical protein